MMKREQLYHEARQDLDFRDPDVVYRGGEFVDDRMLADAYNIKDDDLLTGPQADAETDALPRGGNNTFIPEGCTIS